MRIFAFILGLWFSVSCTSNTIYKKPEDLIPPGQMVDILTDMYLANGAYSVTNKYGDKKVDYLPLIYEKYGIDSARFHHSNIYYLSKINRYEAIYKKVEQRLREIKKQDSIAHYSANKQSKKHGKKKEKKRVRKSI